MPFTWRRLTGIPHVRDVGATAELADSVPGQHRPIYYAGSDGSLWQSTITNLLVATQVPSPGDLVRVAVASNGDVWCVDARDALWLMRGTIWFGIDVPNEKVRNVDVARDGTVYLVMANGITSMVPGGAPFFHGVFVTVHALAGVGRPQRRRSLLVRHGVSRPRSARARCADARRSTAGRIVPDTSATWSILSVARDGAVWMTKSDGTSWITTDGATQLRMGEAFTGLVRLAAHSVAITLAVASDGTAWSWENLASPPPVEPPPQPPPPPPPPQGSAPRVSRHHFWKRGERRLHHRGNELPAVGPGDHHGHEGRRRRDSPVLLDDDVECRGRGPPRHRPAVRARAGDRLRGKRRASGSQQLDEPPVEQHRSVPLSRVTARSSRSSLGTAERPPPWSRY